MEKHLNRDTWRLLVVTSHNNMDINWIGLETFVTREVKRFMRVSIQTIVTPWISALLFIFIFGFVVGKKIDLIGGVSYMEFVLPGVLMMNIIASAFSHTSSSLYFQRFTRQIEEMLVAPISHLEMIIGYVSGAVLRSLIVGIGILIIALFFGAAGIDHLGLFVFYVMSVSIIFALLGLIVALWAEGMEQLNILNTFLIMPLSFFGGVFNSVDMLPTYLQGVAMFNPFFYFIDGIRYSMAGIHEAPIALGLTVICSLIIILTIIVWKIFSSGWKLRV